YGVHTMDRMIEVMGQCLQIAETTKEDLVHKNIMIYRYLAEMLKNPETTDFAIKVGRESEEAFLREVMKDESRAVTLYQIYTYKTQLDYLFGNIDDAIRHAEMAQPFEGL